MKIKTRLNLNTIISLGAVAFIILSLAWSYNENLKATRDLALVEEIRNVAFERIMLRDDYLLHGEERAKIQWHAKSGSLRRLLDTADQRFTDGDDRDLLREARKDFDATFISFSGFMERRKRKESDRTVGVDLAETESMLISQAFLKAYSLTGSINRLQVSTERKAAGVRERSIVTVVFFMIAGIAMIIANSMFLSRLLNKRMAALRKGIEIVGAGDFDYRIDARGDDELSVLAMGTNEMAGKLKMSHISVETLRQEITERYRAEEKLKESEERLVEAQRVARLGYYDLDVATGTWTSSKVLDGIFDIGDDYRRDVEGWSLLVHPEERPAMLDYLLNDVLAKKRPFDREYRIVRSSDRCVRWVHGLGKVECDSRGKPVKMVGTIQDVTERKQAEEERRKLEQQVQEAQKLESLSVLAGGIAHDFNNLLMVVMGHAELALDEIPPTSAARRDLAEITTAARRAAELSLQMLAYSGKAFFAVERMGLADLVEEMEQMLRTAISKKATLNLGLEPGLPPIKADPSQIRQVVLNLVVNASESLADGSGVITVSVGATRCDEEYLHETELRDALVPGLYVHLAVTDTGAGMDAGTRSRIFDPFFSTKFTGRGLGLAAVLGIVRAHKGALKVYSEPGKGTTFRILFPALREGEDAAISPESSHRAPRERKGAILLVDDEETLLTLGGCWSIWASPC